MATRYIATIITALILLGTLTESAANDTQVPTKRVKGRIAILPGSPPTRDIYPQDYIMSPYKRPLMAQSGAKQSMLSSILTPRQKFDDNHLRRQLWNSLDKDSKLRQIYNNAPSNNRFK